MRAVALRRFVRRPTAFFRLAALLWLGGNSALYCHRRPRRHGDERHVLRCWRDYGLHDRAFNHCNHLWLLCWSFLLARERLHSMFPILAGVVTYLFHRLLSGGPLRYYLSPSVERTGRPSLYYIYHMCNQSTMRSPCAFVMRYKAAKHSSRIGASDLSRPLFRRSVKSSGFLAFLMSSFGLLIHHFYHTTRPASSGF